MGVISRLFAGESGQMTVQFAVAFPVMLIIAIIMVNALLFFSECASFDRSACEAVRVHATAPAYGQALEGSVALVQSSLSEQFDRSYLTTEVSAAGEGLGCVRFTARLLFHPTLFGHGARDEVFGVALPPLTHEVSYVVDPYRAGVFV